MRRSSGERPLPSGDTAYEDEYAATLRQFYGQTEPIAPLRKALAARIAAAIAVGADRVDHRRDRSVQISMTERLALQGPTGGRSLMEEGISLQLINPRGNSTSDITAELSYEGARVSVEFGRSVQGAGVLGTRVTQYVRVRGFIPIEIFLFFDWKVHEPEGWVEPALARGVLRLMHGGQSSTPTTPRHESPGPALPLPSDPAERMAVLQAQRAQANSAAAIAVAGAREAKLIKDANDAAQRVADTQATTFERAIASMEQARAFDRRESAAHLTAVMQAVEAMAAQSQAMFLRLGEARAAPAPPSQELVEMRAELAVLRAQNDAAQLARERDLLAAAEVARRPVPPPVFIAPAAPSSPANAYSSAPAKVALQVAASSTAEQTVELLRVQMMRGSKPLPDWLVEQLDTRDPSKRLRHLVEFARAFQTGSEIDGHSHASLVLAVSQIRAVPTTTKEAGTPRAPTLIEPRAVECGHVAKMVHLLNEQLSSPRFQASPELRAELIEIRRDFARRLYELFLYARGDRQPEEIGNVGRHFLGLTGLRACDVTWSALDAMIINGTLAPTATLTRQLLTSPLIVHSFGPQSADAIAADTANPGDRTTREPCVLLPSLRAAAGCDPADAAAAAPAASREPAQPVEAPWRAISLPARPTVSLSPATSMAPSRSSVSMPAESASRPAGVNESPTDVAFSVAPPPRPSGSAAPSAAPAAKSIPAAPTGPKIGGAPAAPARGGLPHYGGPTCWSSALACAVGSALRRVDVGEPSLFVRRLRDQEWVRTNGSKAILDALGVGLEARDAERMLAELLRRVPAAAGTRLIPLSQLLIAGEVVPEGIEPLAALGFREERRHWTAFTRDGGGAWTEHDIASTPVGAALPTDASYCYIWRAPRVGGAAPDLCGGCGTAVHNHRQNACVAKCAGCGQFFVGGCTGIASHDRQLLTRTPGWKCTGCVVRERHGDNAGTAQDRRRKRREEERVAAAAAAAAEAATAPVVGAPPPRSGGAAAAASPPAASPAAARAPKGPGRPPARRPVDEADRLLPVEPEPAARVPASAPLNLGDAAQVSPPPSYEQTVMNPAVPFSPPRSGFVFSPGDFRGGQAQVPALAPVYTGIFLTHLRLRPVESVPSVVEQALSPAVRQRHRFALAQVFANLEANPTWASLPLADFLIRLLCCKAVRQQWQPQTLFREACNISGMFSNLPVYTDATHPVQLRNSAEWRAAMDTWSLQAQQGQPSHLTAVSRDELFAALVNTPEDTIRIALLMMWLTAARPGCTLQLRPDDVEMDPTGAMTVRFASGKGVRFRGPYTVHTKVPPDLVPEVAFYLATMRQARAPLLFPATADCPMNKRMPRLLAALRTANPSLNLRAMRRGSLQTMALAGTPADVLMTYSGHTNVGTLKRYLDWGRLFGAEAAAGQAAARLLAGPP